MSEWTILQVLNVTEQLINLAVYSVASICTSKSCCPITPRSHTHSGQHEVSVQQSCSLFQIPGLADSIPLLNSLEFLTYQSIMRYTMYPLRYQKIKCQVNDQFQLRRSCRHVFNNPINRLQWEKTEQVKQLQISMFFNFGLFPTCTNSYLTLLHAVNLRKIESIKVLAECFKSLLK